MKKLIPLRGEGRRVLKLTEGAPMAAEVSPAAQGRLWLCDESGALTFAELEAGRCTVACRGFAGAAITRNGEVTHTGGFAGRKALESRALSEIRMRASAARPVQTVEPKSGAPAPHTVEPKKTNSAAKTKEPESSGPAPQCSEPKKTNPAPQPDEQKRNDPVQQKPRAEEMCRRSAALCEILEKAQELFAPLGEQQQAAEREPQRQEEGDTVLNPFPQAFPFSRWRRVTYPGTDSCYLEGETLRNGVAYSIYALPGEYRSRPRAKGFDKFLRSRDGSGYWIRLTRI